VEHYASSQNSLQDISLVDVLFAELIASSISLFFTIIKPFGDEITITFYNVGTQNRAIFPLLS
jgi:hypothetical protein